MMNDMTPEQLAQAVLNYIEAGKKVLAHRIVTILTLIATMGIYGYAAWSQTWQSIGLAGMFGVLVLWPIMRHEMQALAKNAG
jgi:uncharacterized membrane protein